MAVAKALLFDLTWKICMRVRCWLVHLWYGSSRRRQACGLGIYTSGPVRLRVPINHALQGVGANWANMRVRAAYASVTLTSIFTADSGANRLVGP